MPWACLKSCMRHQTVPSGPWAWLFLISVLMVSVQPQPAAAQGFLESIFGFLGSKPKPAPQTTGRPGPRDSRALQQNPFGGNRPVSRPAWSRSGRYKTVCVRLCDGYYFPINHRSRRQEFYDDAEQCQARCHMSEARLFHLPSSGSIEQARDQRGLPYKALKTAFLYRKKLVKSCTCRPAPWTVSERVRHRTYALNEPEARLADGGDATQVAAGHEGANDNDGGTGNTPLTVPPVAPAPSLASVPQRYLANPKTVPAPRAARRLYARPQGVGRIRPAAPARAKKKTASSSGFAGLPPVRYRHKWTTDD